MYRCINKISITGKPSSKSMAVYFSQSFVQCDICHARSSPGISIPIIQVSIDWFLFRRAVKKNVSIFSTSLMATRFLQPRQTKYRGIQSNHNSTGQPNSISLPSQSELSGHSTPSTIEDLTARVSTYVITSWDLPDIVRPNDWDLLHDVLPYARDIREEEHGEEACYTTEAGQCHSPKAYYQLQSHFPKAKYICMVVCGRKTSRTVC